MEVDAGEGSVVAAEMKEQEEFGQGDGASGAEVEMRAVVGEVKSGPGQAGSVETGSMEVDSGEGSVVAAEVKEQEEFGQGDGASGAEVEMRAVVGEVKSGPAQAGSVKTGAMGLDAGEAECANVSRLGILSGDGAPIVPAMAPAIEALTPSLMSPKETQSVTVVGVPRVVRKGMRDSGPQAYVETRHSTREWRTGLAKVRTQKAVKTGARATEAKVATSSVTTDMGSSMTVSTVTESEFLGSPTRVASPFPQPESSALSLAAKTSHIPENGGAQATVHKDNVHKDNVHKDNVRAAQWRKRRNRWGTCAIVESTSKKSNPVTGSSACNVTVGNHAKSPTQEGTMAAVMGSLLERIYLAGVRAREEQFLEKVRKELKVRVQTATGTVVTEPVHANSSRMTPVDLGTENMRTELSQDVLARKNHWTCNRNTFAYDGCISVSESETRHEQQTNNVITRVFPGGVSCHEVFDRCSGRYVGMGRESGRDRDRDRTQVRGRGRYAGEGEAIVRNKNLWRERRRACVEDSTRFASDGDGCRLRDRYGDTERTDGDSDRDQYWDTVNRSRGARSGRPWKTNMDARERESGRDRRRLDGDRHVGRKGYRSCVRSRSRSRSRNLGRDKTRRWNTSVSYRR
ncbi:unnamed protein product [Choristocarpus tenellus]